MAVDDFLSRLLESPGASSFEGRAVARWRERAEAYGATVSGDGYGNTFAAFNPAGRPRILLAGHIDEIGLLVTYVDESGLLFFAGIGGWDAEQLVGQRVRLVGERSEVLGVIGRKPIHLMTAEERQKKVRLDDLWVDIGARDREDALGRIEPGAFGVLEQPVLELANGRLATKAADDRVGAYVVLEAARRASAAGSKAALIAVATVQEEISGVGATVAAYAAEPDLSLTVDLTHASDVPGIDKKRIGDVKLGAGPVLETGSTVHQGLWRSLRATAREAGIPCQTGFAPRSTATDADDIARARSGVPSAVISIPNRYMHSASEVVDLADVEAATELLARFLSDDRDWGAVLGGG